MRILSEQLLVTKTSLCLQTSFGFVGHHQCKTLQRRLFSSLHLMALYVATSNLLAPLMPSSPSIPSGKIIPTVAKQALLLPAPDGALCGHVRPPAGPGESAAPRARMAPQSSRAVGSGTGQVGLGP